MRNSFEHSITGCTLHPYTNVRIDNKLSGQGQKTTNNASSITGYVGMLRTLLFCLLCFPYLTYAAVSSNISMTKHNLGSTNPDLLSNPYSSETSRICIFCHTPHAANTSVAGPLWNRELSSAPSYDMYNSDSMDAIVGTQPLGSSKLCLSCHDGVMNIGKIGVLDTQTNVNLLMENTDIGQVMPKGSLESQGFTRNIGVDLRNDHPISFTYDSTLASTDGELYIPANVPQIYSRTSSSTPNSNEIIPLENDRVECISCHDPHVFDASNENNKFLRKSLNKFQKLNSSPVEGSFNAENDILCLGCHDKAGWASSAHADPSANYTYLNADWAGGRREFPADLPLHRAACLNCHDTHTAPGANRLLRLAYSDSGGGTPMQEAACYQCHNNAAQQAVVQPAPPDVGQDFNAPANIKMPITDTDQGSTPEVHAITDKDFMESTANLGPGKRHVECTDCHNPHRVRRTQVFNYDNQGPMGNGTHRHSGFSGGGDHHSNLASGVLAGTWGVEPNYAADHAFGTNPLSYTVKKGAPSVSAPVDVNAPYVTREYQVCLKCHSDYAYGDTPPMLGETGGGTMYGTNFVTQYTNQAMEFAPPLDHRGEKNSVGTEPTVTNHRSWHPVIGPTGRTSEERGMLPDPHGLSTTSAFLPPWNAGIGVQTMYCTDCHGSSTLDGTVEPNLGGVWGPHGSSNNFLLKGTWDSETGSAAHSDTGICFKCHDVSAYAQFNAASPALSIADFNNVKVSGFRKNVSAADANCIHTEGCAGGYIGPQTKAQALKKRNLHIYHSCRMNSPLECTWCHAAVPHGWTNKALLIEINNPVSEYGCRNGAIGSLDPDWRYNCTKGPYIVEGVMGARYGGPLGPYMDVVWKASAEWTGADCGGNAAMRNLCEWTTPP